MSDEWRRRLAALGLAAGLGLAGPALADERVDHYEGEEAADLTEALANLWEYNTRLAAILEKGTLDEGDLDRVHQLTYSLENALARIDEDLTSLAETLEEVHLASESLDAETVSESGRAYLAGARLIAP